MITNETNQAELSEGPGRATSQSIYGESFLSFPGGPAAERACGCASRHPSEKLLAQAGPSEGARIGL